MKQKDYDNVINHYVGKPTQNNDQFLQSRTMQQLYIDYRDGKRDLTELKKLMNKDEKIQMRTLNSRDYNQDNYYGVKMAQHIPYP